MLKCQFHIHVSGDPEHSHSYSPEELILEAKKLNYDVLAITCHNTVVFSEELENFAKKNNILLIPGIELAINKKHILIINPDKEIEKIDTFEKLKNYKKNHPDILIIAPHPFFPGASTLKKLLIKHIDLFDAIEHSFCYTTTKNYNKKAIETAKIFNKPLIATSDCHFLEDLDLGYIKIDSKKNISDIFKAVKENKFKLHHSPVSYFKIFKTIFKMFLSSLHK